MRRVAVVTSLLALALSAATAAAATRVDGRGESLLVAVDAGDTWDGRTDTRSAAWSISGNGLLELAPGSRCTGGGGQLQCSGDTYGTLIVRGAAGADVVNAVGVQTVLGGGGADQLFGSLGANLFGEGGDDALSYFQSEAAGEVGATLAGGPGNDRVVAAGTSILMSGGAGNDVIEDSGGSTVVEGDSGDDVVNARDGARDRVDCGVGNDTAQLDSLDNADGCESVERRYAGVRLVRVQVLASRARLTFACVGPGRCDARVRLTDGAGNRVGTLSRLITGDTPQTVKPELTRRVRGRLRRGHKVRLRVFTKTFRAPLAEYEALQQRVVLRRNRTFTVR